MTPLNHIRNFCIIAHVDHGKTTLSDRLLQLTGTIEERQFREQLLDAMDLEREKGITIKCHPVTMKYRTRDGRDLTLNLIDTPGHVDFTYEVSRSMAACEGALLVVDASQGVEAQTVANTFLAAQRGLKLIPVINKIDLPNADVEAAKRQIEDILAISADEVIAVSAKTGQNVEAILEAVAERVPPPRTEHPGRGDTCRALVFDSMFDKYRGVVVYVRVMDGQLLPGDRTRFMATGVDSELKEVGVFCPRQVPTKALSAGEVGYLVGSVKESTDVKIGDTVTLAAHPAPEPLHGFGEIKPMVFAGIYPVNTADYDKLRQSVDKLRLNDSAFTHHPESSTALGFGFRCGFLGLLHMEVITERLRREFDLDIISTHPSVIYKVLLRNGELLDVDNPVNLPDRTRVEAIEEPMIKAFVICHNENIGDIMKLVMDRRGVVTKTESLDTKRVMLTCALPLNEILTDFHDALKSVSRGYASMDYEYAGYQPSDIVKMDILVHGEVVDAFSAMVHRDRAVQKGRQICEALKEEIPPHQFVVPLQAAVDGKIIARENIRAFRKDVTAKLYGGDVTRKMKLLEKQKEGKRRMKQFGQVNVPQTAFVAVLKNG